MKKVLFFVAALVGSVAFFSSCSKEDTLLTTSDISDVTTALVASTDLVDANSDLTASARGGGGGGDFKPKKMKKISIDSLSDIIKTYIAANYADATIESAFQGKNGETVVIITKADGTKVALLFDASGAFVKEITEKGGGKGKDLTAVDVATLSSSITDYISTNYAGSTIVKAATDADGNIFVVVKKADGTLVGLAFDKDGNFVKVLESKGKGHLTTIDVASLPSAVTTYVSTNYAGATIEKAYNDKDGNIIVTIKNTDGTVVRLVFDADGKFVKVLKKK